MILDEKRLLMRKLCREFAENEFTDELLDRIEETGDFDRDIFNKMAQYGFCGVKIPKEYGGQGGDSLDYVIMAEEFARVSPVLSIYANTSNSLGGGPLMICGNDEQKAKYLADVAQGKKIMIFCLTEPGAGSDAGGTITTAKEDGDYFVLNGRKTFASGAPVADYAVVLAKTDTSMRGSKGISMFIVDMKLPGVTCGKPEHKMGIVGYPTSDVIFDNVRVHKDDMVGKRDKGFGAAMATLDGGRLGIAAQSLGIAQGAYEEALRYARERKQFGQPIANFQAISFMLADMATEIEAARELVYSTALKKDAGDPEASKLCAMSKYFASEMCNRVAYKAVQIHGGYGYIKDYKVERFYRDARITTLYEGTSQIQQLVIANNILR
ncbi:MAG: acyl-CoA dehydrogenase family protein [Clostridia bacterium]|nr:acyl-CoA dehydrogenase family protein [Clostridia bacterium]MBR5991681.1 acyl-CoA dehydrogenase family protein [Clostridia bacterium]